MASEDHVEMTFVALKPDAVKRGLAGEIISIFEHAGLKISAAKMVQATDQILEQHYEEHIDKPFYDDLVDTMTDGPILAMVLEGVHAVKNVRKMVGETDASEAHPATIRGRFSHMSIEHADDSGRLYKNLIHAAAEPEEAEREIGIWFSEDEIHDYRAAYEDEVR